MTFHRHKTLLLIILAFVMIPVIASAQAPNLDTIKLRLIWKHQFQFAGYYMAVQKGFYTNRGLDVDIIEFDHNINNLDEVTSGETEFAVGRSSLLIDKAKGKKITALLATYQHSPIMLLTKANDDINSPADLRGKRIMLTPDAASSGEITAMLLRAGLSKKDFISLPHSYNVEDLINGNTDALASYVSNEPYKMIQRGIPYNIIHPAEYGFIMYSDILYTSEGLIDGSPDLVENFYTASIEGWKYAFANIPETVDIIHRYYNSQNRSREALLFEGQELMKLAFDEHQNFGQLLPHRLSSMAQIFLLANILDAVPDLEGFIYKPPAERLDLTYKELAYIKDKQVINVCVQKNWQPYEQIQNDLYQGILADFTHLIQDKSGLSISPVPTTSSQQALTLTLQGICDITSRATQNTTASDLLLFSDVYINIPLVYVSLKPVKDISSLKTRVAISRKSTYFNQLLQDKKQFTFIETNSELEALNMLNEGLVDGVIGSQAHINFLSSSNDTNRLILTDYNLPLKTGFAMNEQRQVLQSILNKILALITDQDRDKIMSYWIISSPKKGLSDQTYFIIISLISLYTLFILFRYSSALLRSKILKELAETDQLTGIANRRKVIDDIQKHIDLSNRYNHDLSLIFFDIDDFKKINDQYGHETGDRILIELTALVCNQIRKTDSFGRWGGEEFVISSPESVITDVHKMTSMLKKNINQYNFKINHPLSCSFGLTNYQSGESLDNLIQRADKTMYRAKQQGKNCIVMNKTEPDKTSET